MPCLTGPQTEHKKGGEPLQNYLYDNYIRNFDVSQDTDTVQSELKDKFEPKKKQSVLLSESYDRLGFSGKSDRVSECGSWLDFIYDGDFEQTAQESQNATQPDTHALRASGCRVAPARARSPWKLHRANFCRDRLCPMCAWRRSYKIFGQVSKIMNYLGGKYRYIFLTLTVPNCSASDLDKKIDEMMTAWHKFCKRKRIVNAVKGFFRALEVTRNNNYYQIYYVGRGKNKKKRVIIGEDGQPLKNPLYDTYHPHFHVVLAVNQSYFDSHDYISRDDWLLFWQQSIKDFSITQVDVRVFKGKNDNDTEDNSVRSLASAVAESSKYAVKSADYIFENKPHVMDNVVSVLAGALAHRRLTAFGGVFLEAWKALGLDDPEDGDLIHVDDVNRSDISEMIIKYRWTAGAYKLVKVGEYRVIGDSMLCDPETGEIMN